MPLILQNQNSIQEFCCGELEITIDSETRIVLRKPIINTLKEYKISKLWRFPSFEFRGIILCPPQNKDLYIKTAKDRLLDIEDVENFEIAHRKYISPGLDVNFDTQGRVSLTQSCIKLAKIRPGNCMTILGRGPWYEIWHTNDLHRIIQNANLKTDQLVSSLTD